MISEEVKKMSGQDVNLCYQCGECASSCQAVNINGFNPLILVHMIQLEREDVIERRVFDTCLHCYLCSVRCPQGISFPEVATALSNIWVKRHGMDKVHRAFMNQLSERGFVNPVKVALSSMGLPKGWMMRRGAKLAKMFFESGRVPERLMKEVREVVGK